MARPQGITKFSIPVVNVSKLIPPIETDNYHLVLDLVLKLDISDSERYKAYKTLIQNNIYQTLLLTIGESTWTTFV